jgi:hypothetical protein
MAVLRTRYPLNIPRAGADPLLKNSIDSRILYYYVLEYYPAQESV